MRNSLCLSVLKQQQQEISWLHPTPDQDDRFRITPHYCTAAVTKRERHIWLHPPPSSNPSYYVKSKVTERTTSVLHLNSQKRRWLARIPIISKDPPSASVRSPSQKIHPKGGSKKVI